MDKDDADPGRNQKAPGDPSKQRAFGYEVRSTLTRVHVVDGVPVAARVDLLTPVSLTNIMNSSKQEVTIATIYTLLVFKADFDFKSGWI